MGTFKAITFAFRAVGIGIVAAVILTPDLTARPETLFVLAAFILGPDVVEAWLMQAE